MKILKLIIISAVVLFLLVTAISFLLPSKVRISRAVNISVPVASVYKRLEEIKDWGLWNEYIKALPEKRFSRNSISSGHLTVYIIKSDTGSIKSVWRRNNGTMFTGMFHLIPAGSVTVVQWYFDFTFKWYPWEKFSSIIYDKQLGPQMEQSLLNLKRLLEKAE
ncbi:MAG: hypothetical protein WKF97_25810 [Chitinophagaceae bacterium]